MIIQQTRLPLDWSLHHFALYNIVLHRIIVFYCTALHCYRGYKITVDCIASH